MKNVVKATCVNVVPEGNAIMGSKIYTSVTCVIEHLHNKIQFYTYFILLTIFVLMS